MVDICTNKIHKLRDILSKSTKITLVAHTNPDGDAIGSCMGMYQFLLNNEKKPKIILPDQLSDNLKFVVDYIDNYDNIIYYNNNKELCDNILDDTDLLIQLDCNSMSRTAIMCDKLKSLTIPKILIDHHLNPATEEFDVVFSKIEISSTCELVYYILKNIITNISELPSLCLSSLLVGMTTDTNNFRNSVFPSTFQMAGELIDAGIDRDKILNELYFQDREERVRLMGYFLSNIMKITPKNIAYGILRKNILNKYSFQKGEAEGFVNLPLSIKNVKISIFAREANKEFRVSIRSKKGYSANDIAMKYFNGGGHELAAGGKIIIGKDIENADQVESYINKIIDKYITD